jgi:hypothetical protein
MAYKDPEKQRANARARYAKNSVSVVKRTSAYQKARRYKGWQRQYNHDPQTWAKRACYQIKHKAKELGIAFDLRPEDLPAPAVCPFTLLPFDFGPKNGKPSPRSATVDRIRPDKGYVRGNVRVISMRANVAKSDIVDAAIFERLAADARIWALVS